MNTILRTIGGLCLLAMTLAWHESLWISVWSMAYFAAVRELNTSEVK